MTRTRMAMIAALILAPVWFPFFVALLSFVGVAIGIAAGIWFGVFIILGIVDVFARGYE